MDLKKVQDIYPLSPMQQGMLFHSMHRPESGVYIEQLACALKGELNVEAFERAWRRAIERHTVLRTAFVTAGLKEPAQVVHRQVALPLIKEDWREAPKAEQQARLDEFLRAERRRGFNLAEPPLARMALFRVADEVHRFALTHHHLLMDGWSFAALIQEVFAHYEAFAEGRDLLLGPPRPYRDYIVWLRKQDRSRAEAFWRRTLAGFIAPTPLRLARATKPLTEAPEENGAENQYPFQALHFSEAETEQLQELARRLQLTLNTVIQGAWALLLSRYSGEEDVVFGATVSGRPPDLPDAETMTGLFINTLPVRVRIRQDASVADWLKELQNAQAELRQYEFSPLVDIQGWSEVPRGTPLFESILVFENYPIGEAVQGAGGVSLEIGDMRSAESTNYALTVAVMPGRRLTIDIGYDAERFDAETITRMLGHLRTLIEGMIADPQRPVGELPLLTEAELELMLAQWNRTATEFPADKCLHQLFAERARRRPDAVAVTFGRKRLTYRDLNRRANQLAHYLRRMGVGPDVLVGLMVDRSPEAIVGILGVLKAGGAYVPLDPQYPRERLRFMLEDANAPVLLTQKHLRDMAPDHPARIVRLDADWRRIAKEPVTAPRNTARPDNLAYVIYTSGSTGRPKGALIEHRGVVNFSLACARIIGASASDRMLQFSSLSFDASVTEIFVILLTGGTLSLARREELISVPDLLRILREQEITTALLPPSMLKLTPADGAPSLRRLIAGGEACTREIVEQWAPGRRFFNAYGPTETTVGPTIYPIESVESLPQSGEVAPIGRPIANMQVYILDERRRPVPIGAPGELYIGGVGLARGYLNQPELTAAAFVELRNPQSAIRVYKTGDLARFLPDGNIEYLGRLDHQVKLRGFRIELGEIEALLEQHPAVRQAAAIIREDQPGDKRLVAYITAPEGVAPAFEELRAFLRERLPDYMLPSSVVRLDALPMTPNGKVDRKALPAPDGTRSQLKREFVAPRDLAEAALARIWEDVLDVRPIGVTDNFFELGGHSLLAVRVIGQMEQQAGLSLPLVTLFQNPTVEGLARAIRRQRDELPSATIVTLQAGQARRAALPGIFFVHPSGGSAHWYLKLARALGAYQPVYGIQAKGLNGEEELHTRIEDMAAYYINAMRETQPQGPYLLGSWSMGVIFVYEMAQQLIAQGEKVALLAIFDQGPEPPDVNPDSGAEYLMHVFGKHIPIEIERLKAFADEEQVAYVLEVARRVGWVHPDMTDQQFSHFVAMLKTHTQAWWNYEPKTYPGRVTLFRASEQPADHTPAADWGWGRLAGGVEIHEVPGDHISMIDEPNVRALAERLRGCIDRALELGAAAASAE